MKQNDDQLPVGLLAQLVEHCTSIAEVMGSNEFFPGLISTTSLVVYITAMIVSVFVKWILALK